MADLSEIDRINQRSIDKNNRLRERRVKRSLAKFKVDPSPAKTAANTQWSFLFSNLASAISDIEFDPYTHPTPKTNIMKAQASLMKVMQGMQEQSITRLGRFNIRSEIGAVANSLRGLDNGLKINKISAKRLSVELPMLVSKLHTVAAEVSVRVKKAIIDSEVSDANRKQEEIDKANAIVAVASNTSDKKKRFAQIGEAMKTLIAADIDKETERDMDRLRRGRAANQDSVEKEAPSSKETHELRDTQDIESLKAKLAIEKPKLLKAIRESGIARSPDMNWALIRGPVLVRTKPQINEEKLKKSGTDYSVVRYSSIKQGANSFRGVGKREFSPHDFVLYDQLLIAFGNKVKPKKTPTKTYPLKSKKENVDSDSYSMSDAPLLRDKIRAIIQNKMGRKLSDLSAQSFGNDSFITSKATPGIRYVWLINNDLYNEIGPFTLQTVASPIE